MTFGVHSLFFTNEGISGEITNSYVDNYTGIKANDKFG